MVGAIAQQKLRLYIPFSPGHNALGTQLLQQ